MPEGNFTMHFGVRRERLHEVVPGVAGIDTAEEPWTWEEWYYDVDEDPDYEPAGDPDLVHISVVTRNPAALLPRLLATYGHVMVPRPYDGDDYKGFVIIDTTSRWDYTEGGFEGCVVVLAGQRMPSSRHRERSGDGQAL